MREILFRAKSKNYRLNVRDKHWVYGSLVRGEVLFPKKKEECFIVELRNRGDCTYEVEPETICQYTGLKDKNGNRIWENDIVLCKKYLDGNFVECHIERGFVEMKYGAYGLHRFKQNAYYRPFKDWLEDYEYEVIGNCFDNPELLKGE